MVTSYPGAAGCEAVGVEMRYEELAGGTSRGPDGKWLQLRTTHFDFAAPSNQRQCDEAARRYIVGYNNRMSALAPAAVARHCRRKEERESGRR